MIEKIQIFVLVLSILYILSFLFRLYMASKEPMPEPMGIGTIEKVLLHLAPSYIITAIIMLFL